VCDGSASLTLGYIVTGAALLGAIELAVFGVLYLLAKLAGWGE